jgi:hypothetical protein
MRKMNRAAAERGKLCCTRNLSFRESADRLKEDTERCNTDAAAR